MYLWAYTDPGDGDIKMSEKAILFSGPMIRAILDGRKTQTRRVIVSSCMNDRDKIYKTITEHKGKPFFCVGLYKDSDIFECDGQKIIDAVYFCSHYRPNDVCWVRETFALVPETAYRLSNVIQTKNPQDPHECAVYRADWDQSPPSLWRPSIHMPRWASRITLSITDSRIERLQDMTLDDAVEEGFGPYAMLDPRDDFRAYWDAKITKHGHRWDSNPWVWAIKFKRLRPEA
jgi:hypothetical protein